MLNFYIHQVSKLIFHYIIGHICVEKITWRTEFMKENYKNINSIFRRVGDRRHFAEICATGDDRQWRSQDFCRGEHFIGSA